MGAGSALGFTELLRISPNSPPPPREPLQKEVGWSLWRLPPVLAEAGAHLGAHLGAARPPAPAFKLCPAGRPAAHCHLSS